jgi:hypothetical protein
MAFTQFTTPKKVKDYFTNIIISKKIFIPEKLNDFIFPEYLKEEIDFAIEAYKPNEAYADKFLITPLLKSVWLKHKKLNLWTQPYIKVDNVLQGRPDYLVSPLDKEQYEFLSLPIVILVEAKHENFTAGWSQCLAEMLACQKLNVNTEGIIYGIVSTGQIWEVGKLVQNTFTKNAKQYTISNLQETINVVNYIFELAEKEIPKMDTSIVLDIIENEIETENE